MRTVFLKTTDPETGIPHEDIELHFNDFNEFTRMLRKS
jgi:hypothetical protein